MKTTTSLLTAFLMVSSVVVAQSPIESAVESMSLAQVLANHERLLQARRFSELRLYHGNHLVQDQKKIWTLLLDPTYIIPTLD